jgi:hypothetical protein
MPLYDALSTVDDMILSYLTAMLCTRAAAAVCSGRHWITVILQCTCHVAQRHTTHYIAGAEHCNIATLQHCIRSKQTVQYRWYENVHHTCLIKWQHCIKCRLHVSMWLAYVHLRLHRLRQNTSPARTTGTQDATWNNNCESARNFLLLGIVIFVWERLEIQILHTFNISQINSKLPPCL